MAKRRERNVGQLSLFDAMASQIEQIRAENIQDDMREESTSEPASQPEENEGRQPEPARKANFFSFPTNDAASIKRLGVNGNGDSVYELKDGSRMYSGNPEIIQVMDGEKRTPEQLYADAADSYLTIQELSHFTHILPLEAQHARQTNLSAGNSQKSSQARNNQRREKRGVHQFGLFDTGSLGAEQPRRAEEAGSARESGLRSEGVRPAADGSESLEQRDSAAVESAWDVGLGDTGEHGHRHEPQNYQITPEDRLGVGGAKSKYADNVAAIRLLKQLRDDGAELATPEEQKILVRYVGWGGLSQVFDSKNEQWAAEYRELQGLLAPDDYAAARRSTQDAHYTSETVIRGIYQGLSTLGLGTGESLRILEPSAGIGNFIGLCPENFNARFMAVELDPTTSAIARYLYPKEQHLNIGFQNSLIRSGGIDAVVGNPPFGNQSLYDPDFPELRKFSVHNYFLAKSIDLLREGGVASFVVSRYFMDSADSTVREHISQYADFLGAVRLPENAFRQNALTDVTADVVFFQKNSGEKLYSRDWVNTASIEVDDLKNGGRRPATINSYFVENPRQVIGTLAFSGGLFDAVSCVPDPGHADLGQEIAERLDVLPAGRFVPQVENPFNTEVRTRNAEFIRSPYFQSLKMDALCVEPQSRKIVFKTAAAFGESDYDILPVKNEGVRQRLTSIIQVRDTLRELLNEEKGDGDESRMTSLRAQLNSQYDAFVRRYGHLNSQTNRALMRDDPEHSLLESLEADYDKGISPETAKRQNREARPASAKKAAIFRQRVLKPAQVAEQAESGKDALLITLRETGKVDFSRMEQLLRRPADSIQKELQEQGLIFLNPANEEWEIRDKYLTGNVRAKLHLATEAAQTDARFASNVEALSAAMPPDIEAVDIGIKFGSAWVPAQVYSDFAEHLHGGKGRQSINYFPTVGRWEVSVSIWDSSLNTSVWGIPEYPADKIIGALLTNKPIKVEKASGQYDDNGRPIMVIDQELTAAAMQKADEIRQAFLDWVWTDDARRDMLTTLYNERFNTNVPPRYDGSHLELVGASSEVQLRPHQKDVVWRSIQEGTALFDHVVGAGKTLACIATVMESKRMGFLSKPMIVVPNHLLHQWRDEFYKLYPDANILVADKTDFTKQNRERLFGRIATGEWDAVIVAHSSFRKIDMPRDVQEEILKEQIDAVIEAIQASKEADGGRATIKQLEKQREKMEARYEALLAGNGKKNRSVDFGDLGVDALFVDESHEFKNLSYATTMNVSGLGNVTGSAKALDLFIKCRYLQREHDGRGVYFMTGTPISNTIAEVYTLQRYMQYKDLQSKGIEHFDAWASTFGQITNGWELDATGVNYKMKSRFASFQNVPELLSMYRTFADVVTKSDLDEQAKRAGLRPLTPPVKGGKPFNDVVERSADQAEYMDRIIQRMEHLPSDPRVDNPLKITNDARKAGLDFRLIDPAAGDHPGSKINVAVDRIYEIWRDTAADKGTQLVFCDLSTPKSGKVVAPDQAVRPDLELESFVDVDGTLLREEEAVRSDDDDADLIESGDADGEDPTVAADMDAVIALSSGTFSVYNDIKQKLIDKGIPEDDIAFIHDANTDIRKSKLFSDMNAGHVRVLLGSTAKMGAGMNVQQRLVAAHHLDAPWRPSDLEQRNGRIIRQGNLFYERDPDNFSVAVYNYATKQTYDARMWQTIEYKAAAIEQFRKGDLLQRVIDDVQSKAANAAEMKAAASGNPLILMQVQLASDLRKLEALYSQHQRGQHRLRDRLKWLGSVETRLDKAESAYAANIQRRDSHTHVIKEKGKEKICVELLADGKLLTEKDSEKIKNRLLDGVKEVTRNSSAKVPFGSYRGFDVHIVRSSLLYGSDGFRLTMRGEGEQEFLPDNLRYSFDDQFSLSGLFQRMDNFLAKGLDESIERQRENARQESAELETVKAALGKEFPQKDELTLARENHGAVIRELQRMQDDSNYVSTWEPKKSLIVEPPILAESAEQNRESAAAVTKGVRPEAKQFHTLTFGDGEGRTEYTVSNQHNGYTLDGHVLRRTYFSRRVGSLGQSFYEDGQWHSTSNTPQGVKLKQFESQEAAIQVARSDAAQRGLKESLDQSVETVAPEVPAAGVNSHERLVRTGQAMKQEEVSMSQVRDSERVYLAVSYNERDAARAAGAKWDSIAKSWYAGPQADMEQLKRWLPENVKNEQLPAMTPREEFAEALRSVGCIVEGEHPLMDGAAHRIRTEGDRAGASSGFYVAYMDGRPAGYVKNNRTGEEVRWKTQGAFISQQDKAAFQAECARKQQERAKELLLEHEKTAERVAGQLSWMKQDVPTPYLDRKGLAPRRGVFLATDGKTTCIPAVDADGKLWSMQYIQEDGTKRFAKNSRKEGCFHPVGGMDALRTAPAIVIAEGYATAGSISDAIGHATVAAFDSGNLMAVATALKDKYPDKAVIIAGDDDLHLLNHPKVRANPGREKAEKAAQAVGGKAVFPVFAPGEREKDMAGFTDFNDLSQKSTLGMAAVARQLKPAIEKAIKEKAIELEKNKQLVHSHSEEMSR